MKRQDVELRRVTGKENPQHMGGIRMGGRFRLGEFLVRAGVVKEKDIERALEVQRTSGGRLGAILVDLNLCKEHDIRQAMRDQLGVEVVNLDHIQADPKLFGVLPLDLIRKYEIIPLKREMGRLWVAMMDPYNLVALDDIRFRTDIPHLVVTACTERDFKRFIEENFEASALLDEIIEGKNFYNRALKYLQEHQAELDPEEKEAAAGHTHHLRLAGKESPIVTLCNFILMEAIRRNASDIHLEPHETSFRVRLRIDGRLQTLLNPPKRLHSSVIARFKVMSEMDITKRRNPQDGHLAVAFRGDTIHFRVSTLPSIFGEKCVVRLLKNQHQTLVPLDHLGLDPEGKRLFIKALSAPQGLILMTGPTGSGKTTTLHAGMAYVSNEEINVVTLEDPVEATLTGINHFPVSKQGGMTFASGLKALLRQDPDVIFVGEIRDSEVASIAFRAAQTGHLVLSTLHTNSAIESIVRLSDLGVPPYILSGSLLLVAAQRLLRRVCEHCAEPFVPQQEDLAPLGLSADQLAGSQLRRGKGCSACFRTGYLGRTAVFEFVRMTREIKSLIHDQARSSELFASARQGGMQTLFEAALEKVRQGETTLEEIQRALFIEEE